MNCNNFTEFARQLYTNPQIKNILCHLQERLGMNANILLFCCFFAHKGCCHLNKKDLQNIINAISPWHNQIVTGLQKMLIASNKINDQAWQKSIGVTIANSVLLAMQMEQTILTEIIDRLPIDRSPAQKIADACKSVSNYSKELKGGIDQDDAQAIKQLLIHIFPDTNHTNLNTYWGNLSINKRDFAFSHLQLSFDEL
jgi:hypothetical protein